MASIGTDTFFAPLSELNASLKAREFSAEDLARTFSERLQQLCPRYNALALPLHQEALRQAKEADKELKFQRYRGPLQGIPYGVKDLLAFAGQPTTWGAKPYAGQVFDYTATVIEKLSAAGAVLAGKLSMVELAGGGGYRCPSALRRRPRLPPTYGLVSRHGAMALSWTLDKLGPFARSAEDCGVILQTIAGKDSKDPGSAGKSFYYTPQYARPMKDLRVGYAPADFAEWAEPATRPAFEAAIAVLKASGMQFVETKLPDFPYGAALSTILAGEMGSIFEPLIASGKVDELADKPQIAGLKASLELSAKDYLKAMRLRRLIQDAVGRVFGSVDVLLAPGRAAIASKIDQPLDRGAAGSPPKDPGFRSIIPMGNLAGLPALVLPCGFAENMPVALQVVGVPFSENTLLAIGREFQSHTDWHKRRPPAA